MSLRELTVDRVIHGPVRTAFGGRLKYHARGGMIELVDQVTGNCQILKPATFEQRCNDFEEFYKTCNPVGNGYEKDYRFFQGQLITGMKACIKEARAQGDPTDPKVRAWYDRHNRSATVSNTEGPGIRRAAAHEYPEFNGGISLQRKPRVPIVVVSR